MAKKKSPRLSIHQKDKVEQIEAKMAVLREKKDALHKQRQDLAAERRAIILGSQTSAQGGTIVMPEPAILTAKEN